MTLGFNISIFLALGRNNNKVADICAREAAFEVTFLSFVVNVIWSLPPSVSFLEIDVILFLIAGPFFVFIVGEKTSEENHTVIEHFSDKPNAEKMTVGLTKYHRSSSLCLWSERGFYHSNIHCLIYFSFPPISSG
jgi:hypothetical protein